MSVTLTLGGIDLTEKMYWADQYAWSPVGQSSQYASDGSRYTVENTRGARPITLEIYPECYLSQATLLALKALADVPNATYTLSVDSTDYTVRFWRGNGTAIETERADPNRISDAWHTATIYLIQVP